MTPDEFRERAATAVEPLQPGPSSYEWLRANVARRRVRTRVLTAVTAAAVAGLVGVGFAAIPKEVAAPPSTGATQGIVSPSSEPTMVGPKPSVLLHVPGDVDADREADDVFVLDNPDGRWGVEVRGTRWGRKVLWMDDPVTGARGRSINGSLEMDDDPGAETLVGFEDTDGRDGYLVVVPVDQRIVWLTDAAGELVVLPNAGEGQERFGCVRVPEGGRAVYVENDRGGREYFKIVRGVRTPIAAPTEAVETSCYLS